MSTDEIVKSFFEFPGQLALVLLPITFLVQMIFSFSGLSTPIKLMPHSLEAARIRACGIFNLENHPDDIVITIAGIVILSDEAWNEAARDDSRVEIGEREEMRNVKRRSSDEIEDCASRRTLLVRLDSMDGEGRDLRHQKGCSRVPSSNHDPFASSPRSNHNAPASSTQARIDRSISPARRPTRDEMKTP